MKLWQKESTKISEKIEKFTVGRDTEMDLELAPFDVLGSLAHSTMLAEVGLMDAKDLALILPELKSIYAKIEAGNFEIEAGVEDVHSQIEMILTQKLGESGKKIHAGRSRNDQVLVDLKLFIRHQLQSVVAQVSQLFEALQSQSEKYKNDLLPGYTHLQIAMPSSFGLWFGAYAEALIDDLELFEAAYRMANKNPLGSGAGYGSSFPLNRTRTTELLGFEALNENVVYAQMTRGKTELFAAIAIGQLAGTISRFAMDVCLYNSQNFGFVKLADELTTGSSIMPHKKNPDVAELLRGKCNRLKSLSTEIQMVMGNLPSGYHREMQLLKEIIFPAFTEILSILEMTQFLVENIEPLPNLLSNEKYDLLFSVDAVNKLVQSGITFRDAYKQVGNDIANGQYQRPVDLIHSHEGSLGNLRTPQIKEYFEQIVAKFQFEKANLAIKELLR